MSSIHSIKSGSDIRGTFIDHSRVGSVLNVSSALSSNASPAAGGRILTPFAAYCYGAAFANMVQIRSGKGSAVSSLSTYSTFSSFEDFSDFLDPSPSLLVPEEPQLCETTHICIGRDPRASGIRLVDAFCRGVESVDGVKARYTNLASTPSMFAFCRSNQLDCDGGVMVTASHLPEDRNGFKFFTHSGGLTKNDIEALAESACKVARSWYDTGILPQTSGDGAVYCSKFVDYMPSYMDSLRRAIYAEVRNLGQGRPSLPLGGLKIVLNAGNGSGSFFNQVLKDCGADVSNSIHLTPDGTFPGKTGVPNPEYQPMIEETIDACEKCHADIGIMLDTDADRCGFVVPRIESGSKVRKYDVFNRNRLIALLGVIFSSASPGCSIVTDSVTSEGLAKFLVDMGVNHVRYLKGYANVIGKAKELTESGKALAEVAIETSGHCAMRENGYLDDGTYTAVKIVGLLARITKDNKQNDGDNQISLFDLISNLEEMDEVKELRMEVKDGSLESTNKNFSHLQSLVEKECSERNDWTLDNENLEGVRVSLGDGFFMLRKSLHDPVISLQIEGKDKVEVMETVTKPLLNIIEKCDEVKDLDMTALQNYNIHF